MEYLYILFIIVKKIKDRNLTLWMNLYPKLL